jgi:hypothetical protein
MSSKSLSGGIMVNLKTALGSFLLGVFCASLGGYGNILSSTSAQAKQLPPGKYPYIPIVRPLEPTTALSEGNSLDGGTVVLDGRYSFRESFTHTTLVYGGGPYNMQAAMMGDINIELIGAAANTAQFLESFGLLNKVSSNTPPPSPPAPTMNTPIKKTTKTTIKGDFVSPYDGKQ